MTLSEARAYCPGLRLRFVPKFGWGWKAPADLPSLEFDQIEDRGDFELTIESTFEWKDQPRGLYGVIDTEDHPLDGYNFVLWSMGEGIIDPVDDAPHRWDIYFSRQSFRPDHVDFPNQEEAGVGYGRPTAQTKN